MTLISDLIDTATIFKRNQRWVINYDKLLINFGTNILKLVAVFDKYDTSYRVFFLTGAPLKVLSVRLHSKSHQKSSKKLLRVWHFIFRADQ